MIRATLLTFVLAAAALGPAARAQPARDLLRAIREATERLDYATAEARAREALARYDAFSPGELAEVHTTLGVLLAARAEDSDARTQFAAALSLDPGRRLDPVLVPPRTVALFESVRATAAPGAPAGPPVLRYVVLPDPRAGAALRSAVLPGWGQIHRGARGRGVAIAVGVGAMAAGALGAHVAYGAARDRYTAARTQEDIAQTSRTIDRLYRLRGNLAIATAVGWAVQTAEALVVGRPQAPTDEAAARLGVAGAGLRLTVPIGR